MLDLPGRETPGTAPEKPREPAKARPDAQKAAGPARLRLRHLLLIASFVLWILMPLGVAAWYLSTVAYDQYASHVGFSVRKEEVSSAVELLGGITELSGSSSSDTDILYEFIQSQQMVRAVNDRIDLREVYGRPGDPVFTLGEDARIEALSDYWQRMVNVFYDSASGLIEVRVLAFAPEDAHAIAAAVFEESSEMINDLSAIARADATRYAREELDRAIERLKEARTEMTAFRSRTQIVDPQADIQGRMGLLNTLQQQLATAMIEFDLLLQNASDSDPRVARAQERVEVIQNRIDAERDRFGRAGAAEGSGGLENYSALISDYEALAVDQEFAEKSYLSALATYETALAEAQRQSRYLASHISPTLAETPQYPRRLMLLGLSGAFLLISWAIGAMIYYSLRDRR